jgi:hypothetical protein
MSKTFYSNSSAHNICHVLVVIDGVTEEPIEVIELTRFELLAFCKQFDVPVEHDPNMLDRYVVGPDDEAFLRNYLDAPFTFDFSSTGYWIEAATR